MDDWLSQATTVTPAPQRAPAPEDDWLASAEVVARPDFGNVQGGARTAPLAQFAERPSWLEEQLGAVGEQPYGEGAGYLVDNPLTRGLAQAGNALATGTNDIIDRVLVQPVSDTIEYFHEPTLSDLIAPRRTLSDRFRATFVDPLVEESRQLQAPRGDVTGATIQALGNVAGQVAGGSLAGGPVRTAAALGVTQAGDQAAQMEAAGKDVSTLDVAAMAAANTAANLVPTVGKGLVRIPAGAGAGIAGNELVNAVAGNEAGTGILMAGALGATLGAVPHARVDVDALSGAKGPEAQGAATADALLADLPTDPTALGPEALGPMPEAPREANPAASVDIAAPAAVAVRPEAAAAVPAQAAVEPRPLTDEQIVNPVPRDATPEAKLAAIHQLTQENKPQVDAFLHDLDAELGTTSKSNVKADEAILSKASRPGILREKPWHGVEHVRDTFRFKTVINAVDDLPKIADRFAEKGWEVVKVDTAKMLEPKEWGWRFVALDMRMPNGQLVEYYMPLREMEGAKGPNHKLFEKWRNVDESTMTPEQWAEKNDDIKASRALYDSAYQAALARTGSDESAVRASLESFAAKSGGARSKSSSSTLPVMGNGGLGDQAPSSPLNAKNPGPLTTASEPTSDTYTRSSTAIGPTSGEIVPRDLSHLPPRLRGEALARMGAEDRGPSAEPLNLDIPIEGVAPVRPRDESSRARAEAAAVSERPIPPRLRGRTPPPEPPTAEPSATGDGEGGSPALPRRLGEIAKLRGIWDSAVDVFRRTPAFKPLGDAIAKHYDAVQRREGEASRYLREPVDASSKADRESFTAYQRAVQNHRQPPKPTPGAQRMIDAWREFADHASTENQRIGVKVFDAQGGGYRPIGKAANFFPRVLKEEYQKAMRDPGSHRDTWNKMVNVLLEGGRIKDRDEAGRFLNDHFDDTASNDYFAGIEKARTEPLPEELYDYSMKAATGYAQKWAERLSQIEHFGQKLGPQGKDLFDVMMGKTTDEGTKAYIDAAAKIVYSVRSRETAARAAQTLNTLATGLQLGNPSTSALNIIGGLFQNTATFGVARAIRSIGEVRNARRHIKDAHDIGVLRGDYMEILHDADQADVNQRLQGFTRQALKWGGYNLTESVNRTHGFVLAKDFLRSATKAIDKNPTSGASKQYLRFIQKVGGDYEKLVAEKGDGPETQAFLRKAVNEAQFSYNLSQTPVYANTAVGRFLLKYQKFGLQMSRYYWQNVMEPFVKSAIGKETVKVRDASGNMVDARVGAARPLLNMLRYWAVAGIAGNAVMGIRQNLFGYQNAAPDESEIERALADDRRAEALALLAKRAWVANLAIGGLGFFSNYVQMGQDIADRQRVKNPLNPPGLAPITGLAQLGMTLVDQKGEGAARAIDDMLEKNFSGYRTGKRLVAKAAGDSTEFGKLDAAIRDVSFTKKMTRRYADARGVEAKRRAPSEIIATPMSPINKDINEALLLGNVKEAQRIAFDHLRTLKTEAEQRSAWRSMQASARARQPSIVSVSASAAERRDFLAWARENLMAEEYNRIKTIDDRYRKAAMSAGMLNPEDDDKVESSRRKRKDQREGRMTDEQLMQMMTR